MVEIIAEVAQGYEGDPMLTKLLTTGAIRADADAVKFQLVVEDELATPDYVHYKLFKSLQMDEDVWSDIVTQIHNAGKKVYFDIFGLSSLSIAKSLNVDGIKIHLSDFYNNILIKESIRNFNSIYISIGGIPLDDLDLLVNEVIKDSYDKITFLYGFQSEPTPLKENNLRKIVSYKKRYPNFKFGFLDHSSGEEEDAYYLSLVALGMGIDSIEKHITLDRLLEIEDYVSALDPNGFKEFVRLIRKFENSLGTNDLVITDIENTYREKSVKVVVANRDLNKGEVISLEDVTLKRVGNISLGKPIIRLEATINKIINSDIKKNSFIPESYLCES
jgi:N,N'-diacetyllegionaminate synthase